MNDAIFVQNLQGNFLDVNETAVKRLGYSREELLSMAAQDVDYKYPSSGVKEKTDEILETGQLKFESVHIINNGTKIPVEVNSTLIHYRDKPAVLSIARDTTERKKAEEEKSVILNSTSEMIVFHNTDGKVNYHLAKDQVASERVYSKKSYSLNQRFKDICKFSIYKVLFGWFTHPLSVIPLKKRELPTTFLNMFNAPLTSALSSLPVEDWNNPLLILLPMFLVFYNGF